MIKNNISNAPSSRSNDNGDVIEEYTDGIEFEDGEDIDSRMDILPFHLLR